MSKAKSSIGTYTKKKPKKSKPFSFPWGKVVIILLLLLLPFYYGNLIRTAQSTFRWVKDWFGMDQYPQYTSFRVHIPRGFDLHGIDVSRYQGKIDWDRVAAMEDEDVRVNFTFIKATEGLFYVDPYFQRNWREAKEAGLLRGAYHYFKPKKPGSWQARFFLQTVPFDRGDLLPVIDIEETGRLSDRELRTNLSEFLQYVERELGEKPIIYTGYKFYTDHLQGHFDDYPLWIAHYYQPRLKLDAAVQWHFWQHTDTARVDGIAGITDLNVFNGDEERISELIIH